MSNSVTCFCFREQQEGMIKPQDFLTIDPILSNPWKSPRMLRGIDAEAHFSKIKACLRANVGGCVVCVWSKGKSQRGTPCGWAQWHHPDFSTWLPNFSADLVSNLQQTVISKFQGRMRHVETFISCAHLVEIYVTRRKCRAATRTWSADEKKLCILQSGSCGTLRGK